MVKDKYIELLGSPQNIEQQQTNELKVIVQVYPYFQSARSLYLKALKNQESFKYNNELKKTAAFTTDRSVLFDFITSDAFNKENNKESEEKQELRILEEKNIKKATQTITNVKEILGIGKPIPFSKNETHSFNQWLRLGNTSEDSLPKKKTLQESIIDKFITTSPKIPKIDKHANATLKSQETKHEPLLMTETLAKVYLEQKKYNNAIKAYEILSLKYPEKSSFFATQIKRIQILQNIK